MNYWAVAGLKKYFIFKPISKEEHKVFRQSVSISPNTGKVAFHTGASKLMGIKNKDRVCFMFIDELLYLYKCEDGNSLFLHDKKNANKFLSLKTQSVTLGRFFRKAMASRRVVLKAFHCEIKATGAEFNGNALFEVVLPVIVKSAVKNLHRKNVHDDLRYF